MGAKITDIINEVNQKGIDLCRQIESGTAPIEKYSDAAVFHKGAIVLAGSQGTKISPDVKTVSAANLAYVVRRSENDRDEAFALLETAYRETEKLFVSEEFDEASFVETFFGRARILEEEGLVVRYHPFEADVASDLKFSVELLEKAASMYVNALENAENEIVGSAEINSRLLRTTGIIAAVCPEIAEKIKGTEIKKYLDMGLEYAEAELNDRLEAKETEGFNLANAYHTRAVVLTGMVGAKEYYLNTDALYEMAKKDIETARNLLPPNGRDASVLDFRLAWLNFRHNPENKMEIEQYLNEALLAQKDEHRMWGKGVKDVLKEKMFNLATHLGSEYVSRVDAMYRAQ